MEKYNLSLNGNILFSIIDLKEKIMDTIKKELDFDKKKYLQASLPTSSTISLSVTYSPDLYEILTISVPFFIVTICEILIIKFSDSTPSDSIANLVLFI